MKDWRVITNKNLVRTPKSGSASLVEPAPFNAPEDDRQRLQVFENIKTRLIDKYPVIECPVGDARRFETLLHMVADPEGIYEEFTWRICHIDASPLLVKPGAEALPGIEGLYLVSIINPATNRVMIDTLYRTENGIHKTLAYRTARGSAQFLPLDGNEENTAYPQLRDISQSLPIQVVISFEFEK